ncbi:hypothetical protein GWK47_024583 [Chionoecetes opilio]|uniref:Uncharacterized protein n=1 Tax=Chionoecetes opilio TaxID=41210 RepID=A0A8J4XVB6_CHIOP|nr:hypothetical protein GWK47_024583 [Chionoecetes opilio]
MDACRLHSSVQHRPLDPPANRNDEWDGASLDVFSRPSVHPDPVRTGLNQGGTIHRPHRRHPLLGRLPHRCHQGYRHDLFALISDVEWIGTGSSLPPPQVQNIVHGSWRPIQPHFPPLHARSDVQPHLTSLRMCSGA